MPYKDSEKNRAASKAWYLANPRKRNAIAKKWRDANPKKLQVTNRASRLRRYGLSLVDYDRLLAGQAGRCAVCRTDDFGWRGPMVDHDHVTKEARRILCGRCNTALGFLRESTITIKRLYDYIARANSKWTYAPPYQGEGRMVS